MNRLSLMLYSTLLIFITNYAMADKVRYQYAFDIEGEAGINVMQDSDGFLWFTSMFSGLVRYDGTSVQRIKASPQHISNNLVGQVFEDSRGYIWIGTNNGLNRYDKSTNRFEKFFDDPQNPETTLSSSVFNFGASTIVEDKQGNIWFATHEGISRYSYQTNQFKNYLHEKDNPNSLISNTTWSIFIDKDQGLWVSSVAEGVTHIDLITMEFTRIQHDETDPTSLPANDIYAITQDKKGHIWFGCKVNGLIRYNQETGEFKHFKNEKGNPNSIPQTDIVNLKVTSDNKLVIISATTASGLLKLDLDTEIFEAEFASKTDDNSLSTNSVRGYFEDKQGITWIVHNNGKVDKHDPKAFKFDLHLNDPGNPNSIASNSPITVFEDQSHRIWVATFGDGLDLYNKESGEFKHHKSVSDDPKTIPNGYPTGFFEDKNGNFFVSTFTGLVRFDPEKREVLEKYSTDTSFYTLIPDEQDSDIVWANGWKMHFNRFNLKTRERKIYENDVNDPDSYAAQTSVRFIQDKQEPNYMWIATWGGGLERFDRRTEKFKHHQHDPKDSTSIISNTVFDVHEDKKHRIWATSDKGLSLLDRSTGKFKNFSTDNGFPGTTVFNILEDNNGQFWLGSNVGLIHFDPNTEKTIRIYTKDDGLHSHDFFPSAKGKSRDGQLWLAGFNGLNSFYPEALSTNTTAPKIVLTKLTKNGLTIPTDKALERLTSLKLDWRDNSFEFEYAALSFTNPQKNQYQYMLEGYDTEWYNAGTHIYGRYSSLPGGHYKLRIKGSNNDGLWALPEDEVNLQIQVSAPPWKTIYAYVFYFAFIIGSIYLYLRKIKQKSRQEKKLLANLVDERTKELASSMKKADLAQKQAELANEAKSRFIANMSHELRTPLNAVLGYSEILQSKETQPERVKYLTAINTAGSSLLELINEILDLAKIESGKMKLEPVIASLQELGDELDILFLQHAAQKDITFTVHCDPAVPEFVLIDNFRLKQVLLNLCSNAIKFTTNGSVSVFISLQSIENNAFIDLKIDVIDTGKGIPKDQQVKIFKAFEQVSGQKTSEHGGTGLGLAISKEIISLMNGTIELSSEGEGEGTKFSVLIPNIEIAQPKDTKKMRITNYQNVDFEVAKILIIDDISYNREMLTTYLEDWPFMIKQAENGQQALDVIEHFKPDIILTDLKMPVMDGATFCHKVKQQYPELSAPLIMVTASIVNEDKQEIESLCQQVLLKPVSKQQVTACLQKYLKHSVKDPKAQMSEVSLLTASNLSGLPQQDKDELTRLLKIGDTDNIEQLCNRISEKSPYEAEEIKKLVENFDFDKLLKKLHSNKA